MSQIRRDKFDRQRVVLLVEIERYCSQPNCLRLNRVPLTKAEADGYNGFECERRERWNDDCLSERDVPEWWHELKITGLASLRPANNGHHQTGNPAIERLSESYRRSLKTDFENGDES